MSENNSVSNDSSVSATSDEGSQQSPHQPRVIHSAFSSKAPRKSTSANNTAPFNTCLLVLLTAAFILQSCALFGPTGGYIGLFIALFMYEWFNIHFAAMTRTRRACFDIANVLETYQPRARTHGHLFVPDPPTPAVKIADEADTTHDAPKEKNAFTNARDSHYENMYQKAIQMAKEMEQNEKNGASPSMDGGQENVELKPADPEKDKKESEEKKKEKKKKYDDDMTKPFSC